MKLLLFETSLGKFYVHTADTAFVSTMRQGKPWESDIIKKVLSCIPESGTILDIGGHIGTHTVPYAIARPRTTIHTFEPQSAMRTILEKNIKLNNVSNVIVHEYGLGHIELQTNLSNNFISDGYAHHLTVNYESEIPVNFGGLGITITDSHGEAIKIRPLDELGIENVVYMKIDVEGAETLVIYGAQNTIRKNKPVILIEQSTKNITAQFAGLLPDISTFNVTEFLYSLGYEREQVGSSDYLYSIKTR